MIHIFKRISCIVAVLVLFPITVAAKTTDIVFPILGGGTFSNDFGAGRSGGRTHEGNDIFAAKHTPLIAPTNGTVRYVPYPEPYYGYALFLLGTNGLEYRYLHVNNDTPGTDDGAGGGMNAYAPYMERGAEVKAGQLVGWVGDSGNAEGTSPHLHFEIHENGSPINPYSTLREATTVKALTAAPVQEYEIAPFGEARIITSVAVCIKKIDDFTNQEYLIIGAAEGGGPQVRVYRIPSFISESNDIELVSSFFAYDPAFRGGVDVACGDTDGDGSDELITAAGPGGGPHVRLFNLSGRFKGDFYALESSYRGGLNVTAADLDGDGRASIVVAPKSDYRPVVEVYSPEGKRVNAFLAYAENWRNGFDIAALDANSKRLGRIVSGANPSGGPHVRIFKPKGKLVRNIMPYGSSFRGGVRVSAVNKYNSEKGSYIATVPATDGGASFKLYNYRGVLLNNYKAFEEWWRGGYDVALSEYYLWFGSRSTERRASVQWDRLNN